MKIIITNRFYIYNCSNPKIESALKKYLTITNPKYTEAQRNGRNFYHIPNTVTMFKTHNTECFSVPLGIEDYLNQLLDNYAPKAEFEDRTTYSHTGISYTCKITPYETQWPSINAGLKYNSGVISLPTGTGKTVVALYLIFMRKQKTMILVHSKLLFYQWQERILEFLDYDCGLVGDGKFIVKDITVGLVKTVVNRSKDSDFAKEFGYLIVDEAHKTASTTFTIACSFFQPAYLTGLTATPDRRDGMAKFIFFALGDLIYYSDKSVSVAQGKILKPEINKINTKLTFDIAGELQYTELISKLKKSDIRNQMICDHIENISKINFSCCLVVSDHTTHLKLIQDILESRGIKYSLLTGKLTTKQTKKVTQGLKENKIEILLATAGLISEGYDHSGFTDMLFTMPISHYVRHEQLIGRLVRVKAGKKAVVIHDFVDNDRVFQNQWSKRFKVYESY